jgi:hypothetical protein
VVWWDDPQATAAEVVNAANIDTAHQGAPIVTIGWLLKQDNQGVTICCESLGGGDYRGATFVLAPLVRKIQVLRRERGKNVGRVREPSAQHVERGSGEEGLQRGGAGCAEPAL